MSTMSSTWKARLVSYTQSWEPTIVWGSWSIYEAAKEAYGRRDYRTLFSIPKLKDAGFYVWYKTLNVHFLRFETEMSPLAELIPQAQGIVLELGPGMGNQLRHFDTSKVTRVIGVENNARFAPNIEEQIEKHGLQDIYELVTTGVEDARALEMHGVVPGSLDTVLSIQVLCSVDNPKAVAKDLYRLLKPGGRLIFWEHHRNSDWLTAIMQYAWNMIWPHMVGGCNLNRDLKSVVINAGEWENIEVIQSDETPEQMMPRIWGVLTKPHVQ